MKLPTPPEPGTGEMKGSQVAHVIERDAGLTSFDIPDIRCYAHLALPSIRIGPAATDVPRGAGS